MTKLNSVSPFFVVGKLATSLDYYQNQLGFDCRFSSPEDEPFFAILGRDSVSIMLKEASEEVQPVPNLTLHEYARWDAFVSVSEPDELHAEFQTQRANFHAPLANDDDGLRGFEIIDPDGYVIFFGRPVNAGGKAAARASM